MSETRPIGIGYRKSPETTRPGPVVRAKILSVAGGVARERPDSLAGEEPLEIRVMHRGGEHRVAVTMRTPGNDFELAVGFLAGEGMLVGADDLEKISYCASGPPEQLYNIVTVELAASAPFDAEQMRRNFYTSSSCGVCGKASLESLDVRCAPLADGMLVDAALFERLPDALRSKQRVFEKTGGLHAAGLFDASGRLLLAREDVGRHNAVDKVVGSLLLERSLPARERILQVSGRASFEIMQKALAAGIPIVSAVSAPSSLAVDLARRFGMTLVGFVRAGSYNVYAGASRIRFASSNAGGVSTSNSD